jgi:hypothetical protein
MSLKVVGAGLGRTGTHSLKIGLERLFGKPCYHMVEVFQHPEHVAVWQAAADGEPVNWEDVFSGYGAAVDWPSSAFYKDQAQAYPEALVLLSVRDPELWWESAHNTIFRGAKGDGTFPGPNPEWSRMVETMMANRFTIDLNDKDHAIAAYNAHNEEVKRAIPADRLLVWTPTDGWEPICSRLGIPVPAEPFPLTNTRQEFLARFASPGGPVGPHAA